MTKIKTGFIALSCALFLAGCANYTKTGSSDFETPTVSEPAYKTDPEKSDNNENEITASSSEPQSSQYDSSSGITAPSTENKIPEQPESKPSGETASEKSDDTESVIPTAPSEHEPSQADTPNSNTESSDGQIPGQNESKTSGGKIPEKSDNNESVTPDTGNTGSEASQTESIPEENEMKIIVNGKEFSAKFCDTKAAEEFKAMLPLTLDMSELNGNEKYIYLDNRLTAASENVGHINSGDIMLYGSNCVVLFYESFSTPYSYTRIGYIEDPAGIEKAVGSGNVTVTFKAE